MARITSTKGNLKLLETINTISPLLYYTILLYYYDLRMIATVLCAVSRRPSTVYSRTPNWNNKERKGSAVLLDALVINKSQSAAVVMSDTGQVATIVVQQPSLSANSPEQGHEGCQTAPVELPIDFNRWPDFANSISSQQYHDFQMKWVALIHYLSMRYFKLGFAFWYIGLFDK